MQSLSAKFLLQTFTRYKQHQPQAFSSLVSLQVLFLTTQNLHPSLGAGFFFKFRYTPWGNITPITDKELPSGWSQHQISTWQLHCSVFVVTLFSYRDHSFLNDCRVFNNSWRYKTEYKQQPKWEATEHQFPQFPGLSLFDRKLCG